MLHCFHKLLAVGYAGCCPLLVCSRLHLLLAPRRLQVQNYDRRQRELLLRMSWQGMNWLRLRWLPLLLAAHLSFAG